MDRCQGTSLRAILCIGSDVSTREVLAQTLGDYELVFAARAFEAISSMNARAFDGYLCNYWLPDWNGPQLCRAVREIDANCPFVFYSVASGDTHLRRAERAGASACILAGETEVLKATLHRLLSICEANSLEASARMEEALRLELERCSARSGVGASFIERSARARAHKAFTEAGGSRAHFERWWPQLFAGMSTNRTLNAA